MKAVIMAGGEGTRLRPLTSNTPKPMMPLVNRPMMEHVIDLLKRHGIDEIVVTVAFMAKTIRDYFGDGSELGIKVVYAVEETPLGTAGSVRNAMDQLDERFLVISGDVLTDIDLSAVVSLHEQRSAVATIGLARVENPLEFGIVITRDDGSIERFLEKPSWGQVFSDTINTGIFVLEPEIFDYIPDGRSVDFSGEVFPALLEAGRPLYGAVVDGYWEDVGTLEAYIGAHQDILDGKVSVDIEGFEVSPGVWVGENAEVHPDAVIQGPAVIGSNSRIGAGTRVGEYVVLGANVRARGECALERSVVHDNTYLGEQVRLRGAIVGASCDLRRGSRVDDGAVLGDECFIGENADVTPGVKVYPFKTVEAGAVVNSSIVFESRGARSLFGVDGVTGLANVDVTPELATRLAMAYASTLAAGTTVVTSRDSSRSARMLKRAIMAGLNAGGVDVEDLEVATIPVTRFTIRRPKVSGGISVTLVPNDSQSVRIRFFDADGLDLDEGARRKIERLFAREDFRRVFPAEIGDIGFAPRALEHYATALERTVDIDRIRTAGFKLVVDYLFGATSFTMPNVLAKLGLDALVRNPFVSTAGMLAADIGRVLSDTQALLAMIVLLDGHLDGESIALPVGVSDRAVELAEQAGHRVELTKMSNAAVLEASTQPGVGFAGNLDGGFILPGFLPGFDAAAVLVTILDLLARHDTSLSSVVDALPKVHLVHETVVTPWEQKGVVMRSLVEQASGHDTELVDGVKVRHDDGWAMVLPDQEEPLTHIWAEADSDAAARRLAQEYARRLRQMVR
jgi:mannose-1-phosphate guanylyltransferase/phosphomannomutase